MRALLYLLVLAAALSAQPNAEKSKLARLLPDPSTFSGKPAGPAQFYLANLYEYIDGGAEAYHQYGLAGMVHLDFRASETDVTADIYDLGDPLRAFGIYAAERAPDYHFLDIGAEGYGSDQILNFLQENYYVKLSAFSGQGSAAALLESVARAVSARIGGGRSLPQAVAWFPARGLVARSQKYVVESPLGHDFLAPAATALYRFGAQETTLVVSLASTPQDAAARVARLRAHFQSSGKVAPVAGLPMEAWRGTNSFEDDIIFFASGRYALLVSHPPADCETFLKDLVSCAK